MLDALTVDDALRMLGAKPASGTSPRQGSAGSSGDAGSPPSGVEAPARAVDTPADTSAPVSGDWRDALRTAGAGPANPAKPRIGRFEFPAGAAQDSIRSNTAGDRPALGSPRTGTSTPRIPFESPLSDVPSGLSVGISGEGASDTLMRELTSLASVAAHVATCTRCPLYSTATHAVPGEGNPDAGLMCVGEAPGASEDETGRPFIGAAGQLLTKILEAIHVPREQAYICNVLKHRPPGNRNPLPEEVAACSPYLLRQIELVRPKVILALGTFAAQTLLNSQLSLGKLRGQIHRFYGVPLIVTYHPAALLRNPSWKRPTWEDVQLARRILDSSVTGA